MECHCPRTRDAARVGHGSGFDSSGSDLVQWSRQRTPIGLKSFGRRRLGGVSTIAISREGLAALLSFREPSIQLMSVESGERDGYVFERLALRLEGAGTVRAFLTRPAQAKGRCPAILYGHSHGGRHEIGASELMDGRSYLLSPFGPLLARAGYVTLCMDMPTFGDRSHIEESAAVKAYIWYGMFLIG